MLKKIAVFRLGQSELLSADAMVITPLVLENNYPIVGTAISTGFISFVLTDKTPSQITRAYSIVSQASDDCFPVIAWELEGEEASFNFKEVDVPQIAEALAEFERDYATFLETQSKVTRHDLTLDDLLDIVNERGGVEKLTTEEKRLLDKLSTR
jgi:hypothetical protein